MQASVKLFKFLPDIDEYSVRVVSKLGDKTYYAHDANGAPHFMQIAKNECAVPMQHGSIPTRDGRILAVENVIRPVPRSQQNGTYRFDYRLHVKWLNALSVSTRTELDGSYIDPKGYRYFASTRAAIDWIFSYLVQVLQNANDYLAESELLNKVTKETDDARMAMLYAAANGDNYGPEYDSPNVTKGPNTWWASLSESEKFRIFKEHGGDK